MFPISKWSNHTGWIFIGEYKGTYEEVLCIAEKLQQEDSTFMYRIWDDR